MIPEDFMKHIDGITGVEHLPFDEMPEEEMDGECKIYVGPAIYKGVERFAKRVQTESGTWYVDEITYIEYIEWAIKTQVEMIKRAQDIAKYSEGLDYSALSKRAQEEIENETSEQQKKADEAADTFISDVMKAIKKSQGFDAIKEEKMKLPEEELIDEDQFKKMWGG